MRSKNKKTKAQKSYIWYDLNCVRTGQKEDWMDLKMSLFLGRG